MLLLKVVALVSVLALAIASAEALTPTPMRIQNSTCSSGYRKTCSGNTICPSSSVGSCCGGCRDDFCGVCGSSYTCVGSSCTATYGIIIGCVIGGIFLFAIISAIIRNYLRHRSSSHTSSGTTMIVVQETAPQPVIYQEETVVIAPPAQQPYSPNTYVTTSNTQTYSPPPNQYGAPQGNVYYSTGGVHETY